MTEGRLVFFGELLIRLNAPGNELLMQSPSLSLHVGGAEANVAIGLAHLGHDCAMVSKVPSNALGRGAVAAVRGAGDAFAAGVLHAYRSGGDSGAMAQSGLALTCLKHSLPGDASRFGQADIDAFHGGGLDVRR